MGSDHDEPFHLNRNVVDFTCAQRDFEVHRVTAAQEEMANSMGRSPEARREVERHQQKMKGGL
jgi:hypothetical protein